MASPGNLDREIPNCVEVLHLINSVISAWRCGVVPSPCWTTSPAQRSFFCSPTVADLPSARSGQRPLGAAGNGIGCPLLKIRPRALLSSDRSIREYAKTHLQADAFPVHDQLCIDGMAQQWKTATDWRS